MLRMYETFGWLSMIPVHTLAKSILIWLVVSNMNGLFSIYGIVIFPIDELHHFSRWLKHVKTTNQSYCYPLVN